MNPLTKILEKPERLAIGLMSGTSADGIDAALVRLQGAGRNTQVKLLAFRSDEHAPEFRRRLLAAGNARAAEIALLHREIAQAFAGTAKRLLEQAHIAPAQLDLIGSHGQTVFHHSGDGSRATLQLSDGCHLAHSMGCTVVSDFRQRDLAAGGEGAPISAWPDWILFGRGREGVAVLNLGGIANVTLMGPDPENVLAYDTGPANMLLDGLVTRASDGRERFDRDGTLAAKGHAIEEILSWMMEHPFLAAPPPKSTGRETFGEPFLEAMLARAPRASAEDLLATATAFTAKSIAQGVALAKDFTPREWIAAGGGVRNPILMEAIRREISKKGTVPFFSTSQYGVDPQAREAIAMAILANETIHGLPGNRHGATGAAKLVPLGKISLSGEMTPGVITR